MSRTKKKAYKQIHCWTLIPKKKNSREIVNEKQKWLSISTCEERKNEYMISFTWIYLWWGWYFSFFCHFSENFAFGLIWDSEQGKGFIMASRLPCFHFPHFYVSLMTSSLTQRLQNYLPSVTSSHCLRKKHTKPSGLFVFEFIVVCSIWCQFMFFIYLLCCLSLLKYIMFRKPQYFKSTE